MPTAEEYQRDLNRDLGKASFDWLFRIMTMPPYYNNKTVPAPNGAEDTKKTVLSMN